MGKQNYQSEFGAKRKITAEAKLAEIACSRIAAKEGRAIGTRFWTDPAWEPEFFRQMRQATSLLRIYDAEAVFNVMRTKPWIVSLGHPGLPDFVEEEQRGLDRKLKQALEEAAKAPETPPPDADAKPRASAARGRNSIRSRLKGL